MLRRLRERAEWKFFAVLPRERIAALQERRLFYVWDEPRAEVRWMCSFDTTEQDVDSFVADMREILA